MSETVTRRNLPHWYMPGAAHFITYRLAGTIPVALLQEWREERKLGPQRSQEALPSIDERLKRHKQFFAKYDQYLDANQTVSWLRQPEIAELVKENLYHHHGTQYELLAYCTMPNHVHVLLQPLEHRGSTTAPSASRLSRVDSENDEAFLSDEFEDCNGPLSRIMHSLKSYTANVINKQLGRRGQLWQHESYDHWVRDLEELQRIVDYILFNPVRAGLCDKPQNWPFGSAKDRFERDGSPCGIVGRLRDDW
jgi:putative transposase